MLKVNELLDRTSKTISSVAAISLGLAVIAISAVVVKENVKDLFSLRKIKARIVCIRSGEKDSAPKPEEETKPASKKSSAKKTATKEVPQSPAPEKAE